MNYTIQEGKLRLRALEDRSVNIIAVECVEGPALHLVISRDELLPGEDLHASVDRQLKVAARQMQAFKEVDRREHTLGTTALPAILVQTQFKQSGQSIFQLQAAALFAPAKMLIFTFNSPIPFSDALRAQWEQMLASFEPNEN
jgi:hypothetical protein